MWKAEARINGIDSHVVFTDEAGYEYSSHLMSEYAARSIAAQFNGERMTEYVGIEEALGRLPVGQTSSIGEIKLVPGGWLWRQDVFDAWCNLNVVDGQVEVYERS